MQSLIIRKQAGLLYYPSVCFDQITGVCEIEGESYMEDAYKFYIPLLNWFKEFTNEKKPIILNLKISYFNTSSSKYILEILSIMKKYKDVGNNVVVNWFYSKDDPDMLDEIRSFADDICLDINVFRNYK